jgi:amidohydrolase
MGSKTPEPDDKWLVSIRRDFHRHPELSYNEGRTSEKVAEILSQLGYRVRRGIAQTGVVATLGDERNPCLAFRADMDALPVSEAKTSLNTSYRSIHEGVMHACGHDAHTTIMLGLAKVLAENPDILDGRRFCVKFLFQPAEEGGGGAKRMIEEGALDHPRPRTILACHMFPDLEVGEIGLSETLSHASADSFHIRIIGRGGHGAHPDQCADPIVAASHLIAQIQTIVSRNLDPLDPAVVTVGRIIGGSANNIIPAEVEMEGTIRSVQEDTRQLLWQRIQAMAMACERAFDLDCHTERKEGYPPCVNDTRVVLFLRDLASSLFGNEQVRILQPSMGAEDFAYLTQLVPGAMVRLGCANRAQGICWDPGKNTVIALHSPSFDIDERVLPLGVRLFTHVVVQAGRLPYMKS